MKEDSFYIGWMEKAPAALKQFIKKYLLLLAIVITVISVLIAFNQKKSGTGSFEFGQESTIKGTYFNAPVPHVEISGGKNIFGKEEVISVPLVGYGKFGAESAIKTAENQLGQSLNKKIISIKGTLLYNDGKALLQVDANEHPVVQIFGEDKLRPGAGSVTELGTHAVMGEIIDSKCYFGVMKPGEGKAHRDCAIRCIAGGIPPMLLVKNEKDEANYYFILGPNGEKMNDAVRDFVAEPVSLTGRIVKYKDWLVIYVDDRNSIHHLSYLEQHFGSQIQSCSSACN